MGADVLDSFSAATAAWFRRSFEAPTDAQEGAWRSIAAGDHTLVIAPTGSGKTLSAFLWSLDRLAEAEPPADRQRRCRVLYLSPLKALAVDVERNLRAPLVGIAAQAAALGLHQPPIEVAIRSGDTPAEQRRGFARNPSDILITTPESLFLMLTSAAREALRGIETVIIDEVHAIAGSKRGAHLALSLERLDELAAAPAQRIGLSATVRPPEEVARYLAGGRPVTIVAPASTKRWQLDVVVPVPDLTAMGQPTGDLSGPAAGDVRRSSIWPHVEERIADLIAEHRSTLVFTNSRRQAERLTARLNETWWERAHPPSEPDQTSLILAPAEMMAQSALSLAAPALAARAHHGSVSREQRLQIEQDLKAGVLPAVVATSSLELGIDMGAIDLVVQVEPPPSVASGLQRVGRAGHQVGAVSHGVIFPRFRGDLVPTAVTVERMLAGEIDELAVPANPLDVLAQQVVAMVAMEDWRRGDLASLVRRSAPFSALSDAVLDQVLDMLAGRYPSDSFAELRPRLVWDRTSDILSGRRGSQRLAVTSGGTIPDRGLYGVFLASGDGPGRRVGELDEEMVYESRVGDVFALGTSSWQIIEITHDRVLVNPAPGVPARLPFWKGDTLGRPAELGRAIGSFTAEVASLPRDQALARVGRAGLDQWAAENLVDHLAEQQAATGVLPSDTTLVLERFHDELGDWQVVLHSPWGSAVNAPWSLLISARLRQRYGVDVQVMHADDGIVVRLPDLGQDAAVGLTDDLLAAVVVPPEEVLTEVTSQLTGSALFASRFRECAGRALLLPRRRPDQRQALWQQRQRAAQLLEVAGSFPDFPIVLEAVRECLNDVFDVDALTSLLRGVAARRVTIRTVETPRPSPFAASLLFGYVGQFMYEGDSPLAERRAAALALDPGLLADLLGISEGLSVADLLDPDQVTRTEAELQHLTWSRMATDADDLHDLVRTLGPLTLEQLQRRSREPDLTRQHLDSLTGRVWTFRLGERRLWAAIEDVGRLRDALGVPEPVGVPPVFAEPATDPLGELLARHARTQVPFPAAEVAARFGLGVAVARDALRRLVSSGQLVEGDLRPPGWHPQQDAAATADEGPQFCDAAVLRQLRRRSLAALRQAVEPVAAADFAGFLPSWQGFGQMRGSEGLLRVVEQLAGVALPAAWLESLVLPARVRDYQPAMLDELLAAGEVVWQGRGSLAAQDGWVALSPTDLAPLLLSPPIGAPDSAASALLERLGDGGGHFFRNLADSLPDHDQASLVSALWRLVWDGAVSNDTLAPLRAWLGEKPGRTRRPATPRARHPRMLGGAQPSRRSSPVTAVGRWSLLPATDPDPVAKAAAVAEVQLDRYGVLTRGSVAAEGSIGGFAASYRVLSLAEEAGRVRRGYFIEGLGAAQFAAQGAVDRLRAVTDEPMAPLLLAAADPANPYGAALPWPARPFADQGHVPARRLGALVVLAAGAPVIFIERGGRSLLSWTEDPDLLGPATMALASRVTAGVLDRLAIEKVNGESVLGLHNPLTTALEAAGFRLTPRGLLLRR